MSPFTKIPNLRLARWLWEPCLLFFITRLALFLVAYLGYHLMADAPSPPYHLSDTVNSFVDIFGSRWDTGFYVSIAEEGYRFEGVPLPSVAFFPLLPLLMRAVTPFVGNTLVAGMVVSNGAMLLAAILFYGLVEMDWGAEVAGRAVWYLLIFPTAFFGAAIYTESLFLLGAIGSLYFARRGYWESATLLGIAATLTRLVGLVVAPMLLVEWWMQRRSRPEQSRPGYAALLAPLLTPLGTLFYMVYLHHKFGDPFAFVKASAAWARVPQSPLETITGLFSRPAEGWWAAWLSGRVHLDNWLDFSFIILFLFAGLILLYRHRWSEATFVLLGTLMAFSSGLLMSQRRYVWVMFPVFILLAQWGGRPWFDRLITTLFLLGLALFTILFANGYWVA